jgi:hypothetical protein
MIAAQADLLAASDTSWVWNTLGLLSIPLLVALNGLFVAAEFALVAVRKTPDSTVFYVACLKPPNEAETCRLCNQWSWYFLPCKRWAGL